MKWRKITRPGCKGFTLVEMMVTGVIVGVLAALSVPGLQRAYDKSELRSGERLVSSALKKARGYAISQKDGFGVHIDGQSRAVTVFENSSNPGTPSLDHGDSVYSVDTLPHQFRYVFMVSENNCIVFRPNGSAQVDTYGYGSIYLIGESDNMMGYFAVNVLASTGRVTTYSHFYNW
ncbi:MAG: prepilin-type N-terminal cleavage/methylation domain-containing protein [Candidatus Zixiibacteriota bacterium]